MLKEKSKILLCFILSLTLFYGCLSKKSGPINNNQDKNFENYLMNASMIVSKMNQDEKVGEMIMPTYAFLSSSATLTVSQIITKNKLGGVLMAGNDSTAEMTSLSFKTMAGQFKNAYAGPKGTSILLGTDSVHGNQHAIDCVLFPQNIGLGATHDLSLAKQIGAWTAYQVRETGFNWGYAPTIAIAHNYRWGRTYESFSQDPSLVEQIAYNYILGMQQMGNDGKISGILATAKHFLGDGNTTSGMDEGNTIANSLDALWQTNG